MSPILSLRPLQTQSDAKLVAMARDGHERAFEVLVRRYRRQLLAYASRLLGAEGRAEDALQHALLQAWIALRADAEVKEARAWLYRIVHNSAVSTLRRPRHETVELNEALDASACEDGPESRVVIGEVLRGIASLPDLQRRAITLTAIRGDSHGEAAATLGLTDGAVRGLVYRARATMRDAVAGVLPLGLLHWTAGFGARRGPAGSNTSDVLGAAGGAGSAGLAAAVIKGGAVIATAGALATAGHFAIPRVFGHSHAGHAAVTSAQHASRHLYGVFANAAASNAFRHAQPVSASTVLDRHGVRGAFDGNHRNRGDASGRGGSGGRSGRGENHRASGSVGGTKSGQGGSSRSGEGSGDQHQGSTAGGGGTSGSTDGGGTSGSTGGGGGTSGSTGRDQPSGGDGSHGSDTPASGSSSGSGHDSSATGSPDTGSTDVSATDGPHGGAPTSTAATAGPTSTVATPVDASGSGKATGGSSDGNSTDPGAANTSDGGWHSGS